jgi:hypothetical protein
MSAHFAAELIVPDFGIEPPKIFKIELFCRIFGLYTVAMGDVVPLICPSCSSQLYALAALLACPWQLWHVVEKPSLSQIEDHVGAAPESGGHPVPASIEAPPLEPLLPAWSPLLDPKAMPLELPLLDPLLVSKPLLDPKPPLDPNPFDPGPLLDPELLLPEPPAPDRLELPPLLEPVPGSPVALPESNGVSPSGSVGPPSSEENPPSEAPPHPVTHTPTKSILATTA